MDFNNFELRHSRDEFVLARGFTEPPVRLIYPCAKGRYEIREYLLEHKNTEITAPILNIYNVLVEYKEDTSELRQSLIEKFLQQVIISTKRKVVFISQDFNHIKNAKEGSVFEAYLTKVNDYTRLFNYMKVGELLD